MKKKPTQADVDALFAEMRRLFDAKNAAHEAIKETAEYKRWSDLVDETNNARTAYNRAKDLLHGAPPSGTLPQR